MESGGGEGWGGREGRGFSPGVHVGKASQFSAGRCRCGCGGEPSPSADVGRVVQMRSG
jgi:hypothetical protein